MKAWSPALTLKTMLLSIVALLTAAEPTDPQDAEVAGMYQRNYEQWVSTAKFWTESYARESLEDGEAKHPALQRLLDMGFPEADCRKALLDHKGDESAAIEQVLASL